MTSGILAKCTYLPLSSLSAPSAFSGPEICQEVGEPAICFAFHVNPTLKERSRFSFIHFIKEVVIVNPLFARLLPGL